MRRYAIKPLRAALWHGDEWSDGETAGHEVHDDGSWSEDQPTGILTPDGQMIYRAATRIGYLADN